MFEMANIREHVSWIGKDREANTNKAAELVRLAVEKLRRDAPLHSKQFDVTKRVLVIGGGVAGIQAALDCADGGIEVVMVERESTIGGKMAKLLSLIHISLQRARHAGPDGFRPDLLQNDLQYGIRFGQGLRIFDRGGIQQRVHSGLERGILHTVAGQLEVGQAARTGRHHALRAGKRDLLEIAGGQGPGQHGVHGMSRSGAAAAPVFYFSEFKAEGPAHGAGGGFVLL